MSNIFKKSLVRGFTLIELLVVIAIIGLLATVIAAPITQARKKGRDGKKVADIRQIMGALQQYSDDHLGDFPVLINDMVPIYLSSLPPFAASSTPGKDKYMYTVYMTTDTRYVGFHLGSKLEAPALALQDDRDCFGAGTTTASTNYCVDIALSPTGAMSTATGTAIGAGWGASNLETGDASDPSTPGMNGYSTLFADPDDDGVAGEFAAMVDDNFLDFGGGNDAGNTVCGASLTASSTACIYDITN